MIKMATTALVALIVLLSWSPVSGATDAADAGERSAAGVDADAKSTGLVIVQIDGLSEPMLRHALESRAMPFVRSLVDGGLHSLGSWRTTAATATPVTQAGLLHGNWRDIAAFRWWDRQTGQLLDFLDREQARVFAETLEGPRDLLADGGASVTNLFSGPLAAISMANIMAPPNAGDLVVVSTYDPVTEEASSFEPQLGSHGGIGGAQMEPIVLYPSHLEPSDQPLQLTGVDALRSAIDRWLASSTAELPPASTGDEVCVSSALEGAVGEVCAGRERFGARWTTEVTDTADDGRSVEARLSLDVAEAPDETATVVNDQGDGLTVRSSGRFSPRVGTALRDLSLEVCVTVRFGPDRCQTESAPLPQLAPQGTPSQLQRLEELSFEMPLEGFIAERAKVSHSGIDAAFDWSSDGCSAGPLRELFEERLEAACLRHDFAYRNFGQLFLDPTDDVRRRIDDRLAADATDLGQGRLAGSLRDTLQRFGAPVFFGDDLAALWDVPDFVVSRLGPDTGDAPSE